MTVKEEIARLSGQIAELRADQKRTDERLERIVELLFKLTERLLPPEPIPTDASGELAPIETVARADNEVIVTSTNGRRVVIKRGPPVE